MIDLGAIFGGVKNVLDSWNAPQEQKDKILGELQSAELQIKSNLIQAELKQDDTFTKRARPTVIYAGIVGFFLEIFGIRYIILSKLGLPPDIINASKEALNVFWAAWGMVVGAYGIGRSYEKVKR
jgi:hypothetical protein